VESFESRRVVGESMDPINESDLDWTETENGSARFRRRKLAAAAGGEELGCSLYEVPPGGASWPYHYHCGNEEAIYVLAGEGTLRTPDGDRSLAPGDYVACPAGEAGAHRVRVDEDAGEPLRCLVLSTMDEPDVARYPDSGKIGVFAGSAPGGEDERTISSYFREDDDVDYWLDES
jgi:uncharacterized cupin superfamily protein